MSVRPIILAGPGLPKRRLPSSFVQAPQSRPQSLVSNAAMPQIAAYTSAAILGFGLILTPTVTPQGQANAAEYQWGTHAQALHQAESIKSTIFGSVRTPPAASVNLIRSLWASPEQIDLSIAGWSIGGGQANQGSVPQSIFAQPSDPSQLGGKIWPSVRTPPIQSSVLGAFFSVGEQPYPVLQPGLTPAQPARTVSYAFRPISGAPQFADLTQQGSIFPPAVAPAVVSYAFKQISASPQLIDLTQQGWVLRGAWVPQGAVPPLTPASPQSDPTQLAAQIFPSVPTPPAITGVTVPPTPAVPPQFDPSANPSVVWTPSTLSPSAPPVDVGGGGSNARHPRRVVYEKGDRKKPKTFIDRIGEPFVLLEDTAEPVPDAKSAGWVSGPVDPTHVQGALKARLPQFILSPKQARVEILGSGDEDEDDDLFLLS